MAEHGGMGAKNSSTTCVNTKTTYNLLILETMISSSFDTHMFDRRRRASTAAVQPQPQSLPILVANKTIFQRCIFQFTALAADLALGMLPAHNPAG